MSDKFSRMFAEYSEGLRFEDVPPESVHEVKRRILDSIGVSMAAFSEDAPKAQLYGVRRYVLPQRPQHSRTG